MAENIAQFYMYQDGILDTNLTRLRTDLNTWFRVPIIANSTGTATFNLAAVLPSLVTYPCLVLQNNGAISVSLTFRALNGNPNIAVVIPAQDFCYLPQVDYATGIVSLTTAAGTSSCIAWFGCISP